MNRLKDKVALVTGAGAGIGRAIGELYAREGATVILSDMDDESAEAAANAIVAAGGRAEALTADVTSPKDVAALIEKIGATHGRLDTLVNNAGIGQRADFRHMTDAQWQAIWAVNVDGIVRCSREAFPLLRASGNASIVNLASIMAAKHARQFSAYSTTKGAVVALTRSLAVEYAPFEIRVNALCPGFVETALIDRVTGHPVMGKMLLNQTPLRRFGTVEDVANAALFLASDEAAYITGADLAVDGGMSVTL